LSSNFMDSLPVSPLFLSFDTPLRWYPEILERPT